MSKKGLTLAVVGSEAEAKEVLKLTGLDSVFIATNLEAELFLKKTLPDYINPLYDLISKTNEKHDKDYVFENFKIAYDFCNAPPLRYVRDRLGYFLAELERSADLVDVALKEYAPTKLLIGEIKEFPGTSVVDGTLKTNAFMIAATERSIPYKLIADNRSSFSLRQTIGKKIQKFRYLNKQILEGNCDLLILANPRHLIGMRDLIHALQLKNLNLKVLTYNLTLSLKTDLDAAISVYIEKERLIDSSLRARAGTAYKKFLKQKTWEEFTSSKQPQGSALLKNSRSKIEYISKNEMEDIFVDIELTQKVIDSFNPKALLTTTDPDSKILPYIDYAKKKDIKTICVQHGAFYGKDSPAIFPESDIFIAWSDVSKNWLTRNSYFKHLKILVGNSPFHHYPNISKKIPVNTALTILYLATKQPTVDKGLVSYYLKNLLGTLSKVDLDFNLIVRVHPYQDMSNLESLIKNFNHPASFANEQPLEEVISKSDLVIWENTTAGFDAMLLGKPTVYFNPYSQQDFYNVKAYDASLPILGENDIYEKLPQFIKDKNQWRKYSKNGKDFAIKYLGLNSPHSKLAEIISGIIKKQSNGFSD